MGKYAGDWVGMVIPGILMIPLVVFFLFTNYRLDTLMALFGLVVWSSFAYTAFLKGPLWSEL